MNTFLSSTQEALKEHYSSFAMTKVGSIASELEKHQLSLKEFLHELGTSGYLGITVDRQYGGQGGSFLEAVLFVEAISQYDPGLSLTLASHFAVIELLKSYGSTTQKARYLPLLARGESIAAYAVHEKNAGVDFTAIETTATVSGASLQLRGEKKWVVNAGVANFLLVLAKQVEPGNSSPLSLYIVDNALESNIRVQPTGRKLGLRSAVTHNLIFDQLTIPIDNLLDAGGDVRKQILFGMAVARTILAAGALGLGERALNESLQQARTREQFKKNIGQFQAIQWKLADLSTELNGAQLQVYRAAWALDEQIEQFPMYSAMCKFFASRMARFHSGEALQIMGLQGLSEDSVLEQLYRDAKAMEIFEGTNEFQKLLLVDELGI